MVIKMEKKVDRRVIKTKKAICNALIELLGTKTLNEITIKEVADLADVNRKTIYNYYAGVREILEEIEDTVVLAIDEVLAKVDMYKTLENPLTIFDTINNILNSNLDFYRKLFNVNASSKLINKIMSSVALKLKNVLLQQNLVPADKVDLVSNYVVGGMLHSYQFWFNSNSDIPLSQFSKNISKILLHGIVGVIKQ